MLQRIHFNITTPRIVALQRNERGVAMIEMAIVAPLLIAVLFGILQYGQLLSAHIVLRNASAVAARVAVLESATNDQIRDAARQALVPPLDSALLPNGNILIESPTINGGLEKKITLTYNFPLFASFVVPGSSLGSLQIAAAATMK